MDIFRLVAITLPCAIALAVFVWLIVRLLRGDFRAPP